MMRAAHLIIRYVLNDGDLSDHEKALDHSTPTESEYDKVNLLLQHRTKFRMQEVLKVLPAAI
jgi:hypothetical protein